MLAACTGEQVTPVSDASPDTTDSAVPTSGCVGRAGTTKMIDVGTHCIDVTEVTYNQYALFVAAKDKPAPSKSCTWNTDFPMPDPGGDLPVGSVNWCDADAYCRWANKRLCGRIGGGSSELAKVADPSHSEWSRACRGGVPGTLYPYGATYDGVKCNAGDRDPAKVASYVECTGTKAPFDQVFDMSGNAGEWEDACASAATMAECAVRGGWAKQTTASDLSCDAVVPSSRDFRANQIGFRCCRDR
jgi:formylglycine-generating enzyme